MFKTSNVLYAIRTSPLASLTIDVNISSLQLMLNKESGFNYSESKWRKDYAQYVKWKEYIQNKNLDDTEIDKLTLKKLELQKERNKLSAEKSELNKWIREQARTENIYDKIEEAIGRLNVIKIPEIKIKNKNSKRTAIIDLADSHFGREGKIYGLKGEVLAEYSVDIFKHRMYKFKTDLFQIYSIGIGDFNLCLRKILTVLLLVRVLVVMLLLFELLN